MPEYDIGRDTNTRPAPCNELETVAQAYVNDDMECEEIAWIKGFYPHQECIQLVTRQNAEAVIAAQAARIAELEEHFAEMTRSCLAERGRNKVLEADNKRLREALETLLKLNDDSGPFGGEIYQDRVDRAWVNARAALGEVSRG